MFNFNQPALTLKTPQNQFLAALLSSFMATSTLAHTDNDFFGMSLEKLMVAKVTVASAFPEELLNSSSSVSRIDHNQWNRYGSHHSFEVLHHMPSTAVYPTLGSGAIAIRGYAAGFSTVRGIASVLDGVPLNTLAFGAAQYDKPNLGLETLDSIELIRGPSSAIYGSDAFHGVLASNTYRAKGDELSVSLDSNNDGYYQAGFRAGQQLGEHQFSASFSGSGQAAQDIYYRYTDPLSGLADSGKYDYRYDSQSLALTLASNFAANPWYYETGAYISNHQGNDFPGTGDLFGGSQQRNREHVDADTEFHMLRGTLGYRLSNGIVAEYKQFYWRSRLDHRLDFTQVAGQQRIQLTRDNEHRRGSEIILRQSNERWNTDWFVSAAYDKTTIEENTSPSSGGSKRTTKSLVLQAKSWFFDERFALLYGGRMDNYSDTGNQSTPRLGMIYRPNQHTSLKWLFGEAFRAPTASEVNGVGIAQGNNSLKAETIATHELVYMHQREQWRTELVLFYSEWRDTIILDNQIYQNFGESESRGIEIIGEGRWQQWSINGSLTYTDSENTTEKTDYTIFPKIIAVADINYLLPSQNIEITWSNRVNYKADEGPNRQQQLPHYWRSDLQLAKHFNGGHRVAMTVLNLFDRDNYLPSVWNTENGIESQGIALQLGWQKKVF